MNTRTHILALLAASVLTAGAVGPALQSTTPNGVQRGTEVELKFNGSRLADAQEVLFYEPGVKVLELKEVKDSFVLARVKVEADCPLGEHKIRVRTKSGISDLRTFVVGAYPQVEEKEPNTTFDKAQQIPMNSTVLGTMTNEDVDYYQVTAKKGETIAVEVEGIRLGRTLFDPYIAILDKTGKVLAKADDTALLIQDTFATIQAPTDGEYVIEVRETSYGGQGNPYRIHIGSFPRPSAVFPPGGKAGESLEVKFIGDAGGDIKQTFSLPQPDKFKFGVFAERRGLVAPSFNIVRLSPFANVLEKEPNDDVKQVSVAPGELPLAFNGIIGKSGDVDWFRFNAKKGQTFDINVYARRIRSQLDTVLAVCDADGRTLTSNDDSGGADSKVRFTFPKDGEFAIKITDHLGNGGPDCTYRVELTAVVPEVSTYIADTARYDAQTRKSIVVARGNRFASLQSVRRTDLPGDSGDLEFAMEGFPSGVTMQAAPVPRDQTTWPVVFEARADAPIAGKLANLAVRTTSEAKTPAKGGIWQNYDLVQDGNNGVYYQTWTDKLAVAVVDELPFKISVEPLKAPLVQSGSLDVTILAERKEGFDDPIKVINLYNPPGTGSTPDITIPKGQKSATYTLNANGGAVVKAWKIAFLGSASVSNGTAYASSQLTDLEVAPAFVNGKLAQTNTIVGTPVKFICALDQKTAFAGRAEVKLMGLPAGVTAEPKSITKDDKEIIFDIVTATNAVKGMHRTVFVAMNMKVNGQQISQTFAGGGALRIDPVRQLVAEVKPEAKPAAKPATPGQKPKSKPTSSK
ncbi:MAG: pre-peptidase C-terminal domain-containing protein [Verrucomicrobia bacterium]|nr:pre-peptidase C-terminal domain-containing protein [Verrucomicrobiota bacterium]